jgi:ParB family transcriptional regulator, chromosome partitioning protein
MPKRALGKGIGALLGENDSSESSPVIEVALASLKPSPEQPRQEFDESSLKELAQSIREKGVLQPVLAEPDTDGFYTIIAGERRVRAARLAGIMKIPVIVRRFSLQEKLEIALIENVQREDLTPIEEALAYRRLMDIAELSQEQVASRVGKDRSTVANTLRLLKLPEEAREALSHGLISAGHARALLALVSAVDQHELLKRIVENEISVREAEDMAAWFNKGKKGKPSTSKKSVASTTRKEPEIKELEQKLIEKLGTKVEIRGTVKKGRIEIAYFSSDDLERILQILG